MRFSAILLAASLLTFWVAKKVERAAGEREKQFWLRTGVAAALALLFVFKYFNFFFSAINTVIAAAGIHWDFRGIELFLPLGLSFYALQIISYLSDVYYGKTSAETHFGRFALYLSFFPKLLNGPLERYDRLKPQFENPAAFDYQQTISSLLRIGWGLFKKLVIADRLAVVANTVFAAPQDFFSPQQVYALVAFSFQIYIDFSAYTDIAIGMAKILGIDLVENFNFPYYATSVVDFWRRWHISLSNWLRDYVFLPLSVRHRRKKAVILWRSLDVLATFLISGLWHGADWTFVIWGALHGFYQAFEIASQKLRDSLVKKFSIDRNTFAHKAFQILLTFALVTFSWLFFKASSVQDALAILKSIITLNGVTSAQAWAFSDGSLGLDRQDVWMMGHALLVFLIAEYFSRRHNLLDGLNRQPLWFRWTVYLALIFSILFFGYYGDTTSPGFVYFNF